jgi:phytoene synthase
VSAPQALLEGDASALCATTLRRGSKSFALAGRLLPRSIARDAATLYTFCRYVDDAVDQAPAGQEQRALDAMRRQVTSVYRGEAQTTAFWSAFADLVQRVELPERYVNELLLGMQMDVDGARYDTLDQLLLYCYRVAGVVGLMMCHVLGVRDDAALRNAAHLGIALQLTNISRDVQEDWQRGRLYIPRSLLPGVVQFLPGAGPLGTLQAAAIARALGELAHVADQFYASGEAGLFALSGRARFAVRTARLVYGQIGALLKRRRYDVLRGRVIVPAHQKLALLLRAAAASVADAFRKRGQPPLRLPARVLSYPCDVLSS